MPPKHIETPICSGSYVAEEITKKDGRKPSFGALGVTRTRDPLVRNQVLYPLSYEGVCQGFYITLLNPAIFSSGLRS